MPSSSTSVYITDNTGNANINHTAHGLVNGDYVYVDSDVVEYNGFWAIELVTADLFGLKKYSGATAQQDFIRVTTDVVYYQIPSSMTHGWNCVNLPIVYELSNTLWPVNSADTVRTISSVTDSNGYCNITASGDIKATGTALKLEFVKVTSAGVLDGIYQIVAYTSDTSFIISCSYSAANDTLLTNASIQYYYNNYCANVSVYSGLQSTHKYSSIRPLTLISELKLIPDINNTVRFSINDIIKYYIKNRNEPLLGTMPYNLDFFTEFYISFAESYDLGGSGIDAVLSTFTSSYTSDGTDFVGLAVNARLPFKNIHAGSLSEYLSRHDNTDSKFLTLFDTPVLFAGCSDFNDCYQDISFISENVGYGLYLRHTYFLNDVEQTTVDLLIDSYSSYGLFRTPFTNPACGFDRLVASLVLKPGDPPSIALWNTQIDTGDTWTLLGTTPTVTVTSIGSGGTGTKKIIVPIGLTDGSTLTVFFTILNAASPATNVLQIGLLDESFASTGSGNIYTLTSASNISGITVSNSGPTPGKYIVLEIIESTTTETFQITSLTVSIGSVGVVETVSEEKTIEINCDCSNQDIRLVWLNYLGGFDYWVFPAKKEYQVEVLESDVAEVNIFATWPNSYGKFADTVEKQSFRKSKEALLIRSQYLTEAQAEALKYIRTSILVQQVISRSDRRTILIDSDSFKVIEDGDKLFTASFRATYTDDIPVQS